MAETVYAATGRRKTASARARLTAGEGHITINDRSFEDYFTTETMRNAVLAPLQVTGNANKYDIIISAVGGGLNGQAGAVRLAIARALLKVDAGFRSQLKEGRHLTRDARAKERKKYGQPGARKRFQFSKR
ncbi:MAG: small subunit ribosomal protein S9 [Verrucomicrobia bacterium]|jgi:small subunit ribosomal protein S9|nr:MAG: small subunit ribosomal protein S9 [Verrucomicrobiota bacterium]